MWEKDYILATLSKLEYMRRIIKSSHSQNQTDFNIKQTVHKIEMAIHWLRYIELNTFGLCSTVKVNLTRKDYNGSSVNGIWSYLIELHESIHKEFNEMASSSPMPLEPIDICFLKTFVEIQFCLLMQND